MLNIHSVMGEIINHNIPISKRKLIRNLVLIVAVIFVASTTIYLHHLEPKLAYSELVKIATGGLLLIGIMYSIMTYDLTQSKNKHDMRMQKMAATYNACSEWHTLVMMDHVIKLAELEVLVEFSLIKTDITGFAKFLERKECCDYKRSYLCLINYFESLAIASNESLMDEEFIRKYFFGIFKSYYDDYLPFIQHRRISKKNQKILLGFTDIVEKWQTKK